MWRLWYHAAGVWFAGWLVHSLREESWGWAFFFLVWLALESLFFERRKRGI